MQHVPAYGYPTPPASPVYEQQKPFTQHPIAAIQPCQTRYVPVAPEERLGRFLGQSIQLTDILGTGAYGVVYSAVDVKTGVRYAVKTLSKYNADGTPLDKRQLAFQNREIRLHYLASAHPNVVSMLNIVNDPDCIYVILEYCPEGDLFYNITECGQYVGKDDLAKGVFLQILEAVEHCHSLGIYHRDLKPENILVSNHGDTVKLADFGLAINSDRSEDYGCGSTFYMSPECLDPSTRRPFYFCGPNDVWSLGVILVNLTCGRNPWKQASFEDSTYRAYTRDQDFLKSILPLSDELNDILGRIFTRNPDQRISLSELKERIRACAKFTEPAASATMLPTPPVSPVPSTSTRYVDDAIVDDYDCYKSPPSPAASDSSDDESTCSSDSDVSLDSTGSTLEDSDEEFHQERMQPDDEPQVYEEPDVVSYPPDFIPHYTDEVHGPEQGSVPVAAVGCAPKHQLPFFMDAFKFAQPTIIPVPFHHQVPVFTLQGCY